jgi:glycosyltransferase involved in cell wall biosynthesis
MIKNETIAVLSPSFSDGGAERVMSYLVNKSELFEPICLQNRLDYLNKPERAIVPKSGYNKIKFYNKLKNTLFIFNKIKNKKYVITCSYELFIISSIISIIIKDMHIYFRPSISFDYIENEVKTRFRFLQNIIIFIFSLCCKNSSLIFQSASIGKSFSRFSSRKSITLQNPVSFDEKGIRPLIKDAGSPLQIVFSGRLTHEKGFDRFLSCFLTATNSKFNARWICYGTGAMRNLAERTANNHQNFVFEGWTPRELFDNRNSVLVIPSRIEGMPNIVLEAILAGWPVVASLEVYDILSFDPIISQWIYKFDFEQNSGLVELCTNALAKYNTEDHIYCASTMKETRSIDNYVDSIVNFIKN